MSTLMAAHAGGAGIALIVGTAALAFRKGSTQHRIAGKTFVVAMLVMAASAAPLAYAAGKTMDVFAAMLVGYLVLTSWATLHSGRRAVDLGLFALGVATFAGYLWVEWEAARSGVRRPSVPAGAGYVFATVVGLALVGDGMQIAKGSAVGVRRIVRHLWRMCFALFMATVSFFLARAHLFPDVVRDSGVLYVLALAPIVLMAFWWSCTRLKLFPSHARRSHDPVSSSQS